MAESPRSDVGVAASPQAVLAILQARIGEEIVARAIAEAALMEAKQREAQS